MQSPSVCEAISSAILAVALTFSAAASADDRAACSAAYDQTQTLRSAGRLVEARAQASACTRDACAAFIRVDCAKWLGEIDAAQPTVVLRARDANGADVPVRVSLDGKPWLDHLDGQAKPLDPGEHQLRFEPESGPAIDEKLLLSEGEKNRAVEVTIARPSAPIAVIEPLPPPVTPIAPPRSASASPGPWILGGVGVAALVGGAVMTGVLLHEKSIADAECGASTCSPAGESAAKTGRTLGPLTTIAFVVGGGAVAGAAVWLLARPTSSGHVDVGLSASPAGGGVRLRGAW